MASDNQSLGCGVFLLPAPDEPLLLLQYSQTNGVAYTRVGSKTSTQFYSYFASDSPRESPEIWDALSPEYMEQWPGNYSDATTTDAFPITYQSPSRSIAHSPDASAAVGLSTPPPSSITVGVPDGQLRVSPENAQTPVMAYTKAAVSTSVVALVDDDGIKNVDSTGAEYHANGRITRKLMTRKPMNGYILQFRVHKQDSPREKAHKRALQSMGSQRVPKRERSKHDEGNRDICLNCHSLGRKCVEPNPSSAQERHVQNSTKPGEFGSITVAALRCMGCTDPRGSRQLFCRVHLEQLLPIFSFCRQRSRSILVGEDDKIGSRVLSGDIEHAMGPAFHPSLSNVWFRVPFNNPTAIGRRDLKQIMLVYRANLPILPPLAMMKRQTKILFDFADAFIRDLNPRWQLVHSATLTAKWGYCLFQTLQSDLKQSASDPQPRGSRDHEQRSANMVLMFGQKFGEFIQTLDSYMHRKPTTRDWLAIVISTALAFDMFQYVFYLLQSGLIEFNISDLRRFRGVLFSRFSAWGGLRLLGNDELLKSNSALHQYYGAYTRFWKSLFELEKDETVNRPAGKESEIGFRYSNGVPLPLPLHIVQTGYCRTGGNLMCDKRQDRAMCSGCFMEMIERRSRETDGKAENEVK